MANGDFREDLFYRIDVIRMNLPPLRERPEDIVYLFGHFVRKLAKHYGLPKVHVANRFLEEMARFDWPGNVRQLENFSERVVLANPQRRLSRRDFTRFIQQSRMDLVPSTASQRQFPNPVSSAVDISKTLEEHLAPQLEQLEREYLETVLRNNQGRIGRTAEQAGISRRTLLRKMKALHIDKEEFKR